MFLRRVEAGVKGAMCFVSEGGGLRLVYSRVAQVIHRILQRNPSMILFNTTINLYKIF